MAMALLVLTQGLALHGAGAGLGSTALGEICDARLAATGGDHAPGPAHDARHDCAACIVCAVSSTIEALAPLPPLPIAFYTRVAAPSDTALAPVFRWRAAYPARAPPHYA